jgi:hypothetical protein
MQSPLASQAGRLRASAASAAEDRHDLGKFGINKSIISEN